MEDRKKSTTIEERKLVIFRCKISKRDYKSKNCICIVNAQKRKKKLEHTSSNEKFRGLKGIP